MKKYEFKVIEVNLELLLETLNNKGAEGWFPAYVEARKQKQDSRCVVVLSREILPKGRAKKYESKEILVTDFSTEELCNREGAEGWFPVFRTKKTVCDFMSYRMFWREAVSPRKH
jgi:hypothetical protein